MENLKATLKRIKGRNKYIVIYGNFNYIDVKILQRFGGRVHDQNQSSDRAF